jgi:hypothetical protein
MIEQTDQRLREWAESIQDGVTVSFASPKVDQTGQGISLYLIGLDFAPPPRGVARVPLQFTLVYLVTVWGYEPEEAHRLLGELIFAAMDSTDFELDLKSPPTEVWMALGLPPQPSFFLRAITRRERPEPEIKYVRKPMVLRTTPLVALDGILLGPDDIPLAGARIDIPGMDVYTRTDRRGQFHFPSLPAEPRVKQLHIQAKGREMQVTIEPSDGQPIVIHFDLFK